MSEEAAVHVELDPPHSGPPDTLVGDYLLGAILTIAGMLLLVGIIFGRGIVNDIPSRSLLMIIALLAILLGGTAFRLSRLQKLLTPRIVNVLLHEKAVDALNVFAAEVEFNSHFEDRLRERIKSDDQIQDLMTQRALYAEMSKQRKHDFWSLHAQLKSYGFPMRAEIKAYKDWDTLK